MEKEKCRFRLKFAADSDNKKPLTGLKFLWAYSSIDISSLKGLKTAVET
ncbi:MAG: hypothetical protein R6V04_14845 [bacterium]